MGKHGVLALRWCGRAAIPSGLFVATLFAAALVGQSRPVCAAVVTRYLGVTLNASNNDATSSYALDVDQNGTIDFTFETAYVPDPVLTVGFDQIKFLFGSGNAVVIDSLTGDGFPAASLLSAPATVRPANLFSGPNDTGDLFFYDTLDPATGNFGGKSGFVGFRFDGAGGSHYGYVQVSVNPLAAPAHPLDLTLGTLIYDNVANTAVPIAPEPATLGMLVPVLLALPQRMRRGNR